MNEDPRNALTSASNAAADKLCPGRHLAQRGLIDRESDEAKSGTLVHEAFVNPETDDKLTPFQRKTVERGRVIERYVHHYWRKSLDLPEQDDATIHRSAHREKRHWAHVKKKQVHSGQSDAYWLSDDWKHALIEDLKSLYGDVEDADTNDQLRDLAAILWENFGCETITVYVNQPNVKWTPEDVVLTTYRKAELARSHKEMIKRVLASNDVLASRKPGRVQCKFCRACGTTNCPESQGVIRGVQGFDFENASAADRGAHIGILKMVEKAVKDRLAAAKELLKAEPGAVAGWKLSAGKKTRSIENIVEVGGIMREAFGAKFTADDLMKCCKLSVPDLEELHAKLTGADSPKDEFKNLFGHLISAKEQEGSLVKEKA